MIGRRMSSVSASIACAIALVLGWLGSGVQAQRPDAAGVLAAARAALGGDRTLSAVRTFSATGVIRQVRGELVVLTAFVVSCELPDKYARREEVPATVSGATVSGFNAGDLILDPSPAAVLTEAARSSRVTALKLDFARLTIGMFAASFQGFPLTFMHAGSAEAPQGKADVLDVRGPNGFIARLFVSADTHVPLMLSWRVPAAGGPRGAPPAAPVEHRLYYADYRPVGGVRLPFRLRRAVGSDTIEELQFDKYTINPAIDPRTFRVLPRRIP